MKVIIAADNNGFDLKEKLKALFLEKGFQVIDKTEENNCDFVEAASRVAIAMQNGEGDRGIVIDEFGAGSFMTATKFKNIVCAQVSDEHSAKMTRDHNNTSIITMGAGILGETLAKEIALKFIESEYSGGRHQVRVDMLNKLA